LRRGSFWLTLLEVSDPERSVDLVAFEPMVRQYSMVGACGRAEFLTSWLSSKIEWKRKWLQKHVPSPRKPEGLSPGSTL
jgi:hypothetical protein